MQVKISAREGGRTEREYPIDAGAFPVAMRKEIDTLSRKMSGGILWGFRSGRRGNRSSTFPGSQ